MRRLTPVERVLATREGGNVRRCHVVPHQDEYTVGKHSYDAVSMLLVLHPNPSIHLVKALLWHDCAERWCGDMPATAKWYNESLAEAYNLAEIGFMQDWEFYEGFEEFTDDDYLWLNAIDKLELWLWCKDQLASGNQHIREFIVHLDRHFEERGADMPQPCRDFYNNFEWTRLPESTTDLRS